MSEEEEYSRGKHAIRHLERTSNETDNGSPDRPNDPRSVFPIGDALITPPIQKYRRTHRQIDSWHVSLPLSFFLITRRLPRQKGHATKESNLLLLQGENARRRDGPAQDYNG